MAGILKVKNGNTWVDIPAIVGPQGVPGVPGPQGLPGPKGDPGDVQSVAGKTGAVTLDAGDVAYDESASYADGTVGAGLADLKSQMSAMDSVALGAYPTDTASGTVASFSDGGDNLPVKDLVIAIEPVQSGSGDPSPTNVRPISGWTGANVNANGTTIPITFSTEAGTVYGGTLDVTTGVLTVTWGEIDLSRLVWTYNTSLIANVPVFVTGNISSRKSGSMNMLCSVYKTYSGLRPNIPDKAVTSYNATNSSAIVIRDDAYSDVASFRNAITGVNFICELATPQTYQLTPIEVLTLLGANTIYADTGDTSVNYRADPTLYADKRSTATRSIIAGIEPTMTASKAYTTGQLLIVGDTLYKVAASIASGATLTPGTNVNQTTVAEQLILLANA